MLFKKCQCHADLACIFEAAKFSSSHTETKNAPVPSSGVLFRWIAMSCFEGSSRELLSRRPWCVAVVSYLIVSLRLMSLWTDGTRSPHSNYNLTKPDTADRGSIRRVGFLFWTAMIGSKAGKSASTPGFRPRISPAHRLYTTQELSI
jgi:hypothetical protein